MLTDRKMYLSGLSRLEVVGADTNDREKIHDNIFMSPNPVLVARLLLKSPIDYLLATSSASFASTDSAKFIDPVYHNEYATLYKVSRDKISQYLSSGGAR
jgi:hypothetical protein